MQDPPSGPDPDQTLSSSPDPDAPQPAHEPTRVELNATPRRLDAPTTPQQSGAVGPERREPIAGPPPPPIVSPQPTEAEPGRDRQWSWPLVSLVGVFVACLRWEERVDERRRKQR